MSDDPYELYKKNFGITPIVGCINCQRLMEENNRLRKSIEMIANIDNYSDSGEILFFIHPETGDYSYPYEFAQSVLQGDV